MLIRVCDFSLRRARYGVRALLAGADRQDPDQPQIELIALRCRAKRRPITTGLDTGMLVAARRKWRRRTGSSDIGAGR